MSLRKSNDYKVVYEDEISFVDSHEEAATEAFKAMEDLGGANFEVTNLTTGRVDMVYCKRPRSIL